MARKYEISDLKLDNAGPLGDDEWDSLLEVLKKSEMGRNTSVTVEIRHLKAILKENAELKELLEAPEKEEEEELPPNGSDERDDRDADEDEESEEDEDEKS